MFMNAMVICWNEQRIKMSSQTKQLDSSLGFLRIYFYCSYAICQVLSQVFMVYFRFLARPKAIAHVANGCELIIGLAIDSRKWQFCRQYKVNSIAMTDETSKRAKTRLFLSTFNHWRYLVCQTVLLRLFCRCLPLKCDCYSRQTI